MKSSITAGLEGQALSEMEANYRASALIRERLKDILEKKIESRRSEVRKAQSFEDASWSHKAAHAFGYETAILELISLISENK